MFLTVLGYNGLYPGYNIQKFLTEKASAGPTAVCEKALELD